MKKQLAIVDTTNTAEQSRPLSNEDWRRRFLELERHVHDVERMTRIAWLVATDDAERLGHPELLVMDVLSHLGTLARKLRDTYDQDSAGPRETPADTSPKP